MLASLALKCPAEHSGGWRPVSHLNRSLPVTNHGLKWNAPFEDASRKFGLKKFEKRVKFGGPVLADLDGNGWVDIIISHHKQYAELYFNNRGTFSKTGWTLRHDLHGILPVRASPQRSEMYFITTRGGRNGNKPNPPSVFRVTPRRAITEIISKAGLSSARGRGRTAIAIHFNLWKKSQRRADMIFPDLLFTHAFRGKKVAQHDSFRGKINRVWKKAQLKGFKTQSFFTFATDFNNDDHMDIISWPELTVHKAIGNFQMKDVSETVLPKNIDRRGAIAVAEIDFDNDGDMDLVVVRTDSGMNSWMTKLARNNKFIRGDYLLRNDNGKFKDVTRQSGIWKVKRSGTPASGSRGVTVGDFNNDGLMDIVIVGYRSNDMDAVFWNNGDGSFSVQNAGFKRGKNVAGDHLVAADLDHDGRLEIVLSEGDWGRTHLGGPLRIMRLKPWFSKSVGNYLLVRVGNSPKRKATSLHATIVIRFGNWKKLIRRVSSPGTCSSNSLLETVHFGIGKRTLVKTVIVTWRNGETQQRRNIKANGMVSMGDFSAIG